VLSFVEIILAALPANEPRSIILMPALPAGHYASGPLAARRLPYTPTKPSGLRSQVAQHFEEVSMGD